jgi:NAD(P)-dependent dehydrogenase (short-subunit alcohol dehydrogenase family)
MILRNETVEMSFKDKVALVTGGAGGIGSGICRILAEAGGKVIIMSRRDAETLQKATELLPGDGHMGASVSVDDSAGLTRLAGRIKDRYGRLDLLVNNAGTTRLVAHDDLDGLDDPLIDDIFRINLRGPFACVRAFRPLLEAGEGGVVVNISSVAAKTGGGSNVAYVASKAGLNAMTIALARALAPKIRVVALAPGFVDTGFVSRDPSFTEPAAGQSILKKPLLAEDLGNAVLAAATVLHQSTGCIIPVDGGR